MTRPTYTLSVSCCGECPFVIEPDDPTDCWMCSACDNHREVRALTDYGFHPWTKRPPKWCPLVKTDQLIRLEVGEM